MDMKINIRGELSPKILLHLVSLALLSATLGAHAASVGAGGYTNDFSSPPAASGFDNHLFPTANASFIGRVPVAGQLASLVRLPGGQFQFTLAGDASGTYVVDASANLINWTAIQTNSVPAGGSLIVQDPAATGQPRRFYRVRSLY